MPPVSLLTLVAVVACAPLTAGAQSSAPAPTVQTPEAAAPKAEAEAEAPAVASDAPAAPEAPAQAPAQPYEEMTPVPLPPTPHYKADLGIDLGADTFLFRHGQTGFALEVSPRVSFVLSRWIDAGFYLGLGYGGPISEWSQMTTFGIGLFANGTVPLTQKLSINPWAGVMYHYGFIEGYAEPLPQDQVVAFPHQSVRIDVHTDLSMKVSALSALNFGLYCKTRLAPVSEGPGTADQLSYGLRISAVSAF